jgi:hypothetical protein
MTPAEIALQAMKFRRLRHLGTTQPFCATCGERRWWVRYELHHIAGRKYSPEVIRPCLNCHDGISTMQRLLDPLDDCPDPNVAVLIAKLEGSALLHEKACATMRDTAQALRLIARAPSNPSDGSAT